MKEKMTGKISVFSIVSMTILIMFTIFFIFPFYWIATGAFKIQEVAISIPPEWFPLKPTLENFDKLLGTDIIGKRPQPFAAATG